MFNNHQLDLENSSVKAMNPFDHVIKLYIYLLYIILYIYF